VMVREQFGQPVGTFQAVQHMCADMLIAARSSHIAARDALDASGDLSDNVTDAILTRGYVGAATSRVAELAIQLHGGIGYTWERGEHLSLRRCYLNSMLILDTRHGRSVALANSAETSAP
jgi:alkylation response protein AidB-like acyl-CoA dehydrogenase